MIPALLSVIIAFSIMATAAGEVVLTNLSVSDSNVKYEQAFNIAEAGLNYYLWHLDHNSTDYEDGHTGITLNPTLGYGPFVHQYVDQNLVDEGTYTIWVNPPAVAGSTISTVTSIGQATGSKVTRTLQAQIGEPSFASYGVISDSPLWFGNDETADGPIFSNSGVRMDGPNTSSVASANSTYVPAFKYGGDGSTTEPGVWCSSSVITPVNCNTRSKSDWYYPLPSVNFGQVSSSICTMKKVALANNAATASIANQANACTQTPVTLTSSYLPQRSTTYNLQRGYLIMLNNNNTYNLYDVNAETDTQPTAATALSTTVVSTNTPIPSSGVIFAEDNVWVQTNPTFTGRVSIAAGKMNSASQSTDANIVISGPLVYGTKNGTDAIGLVAQNSVLVAPYAPPRSGAFTFEIDGALLAETGDVKYPSNYRSAASNWTQGWVNANQQLFFYGSVATLQTWTWNWFVGTAPCPSNTVNDPVNGCISGIENTITQYDYNLEYSPPPSYPTTAGNNILSWREVLYKP